MGSQWDGVGFKHPSLQVIPERATVTHINEKYIYPNGTLKVRRYGRKSAYYVNMEGTTKMEFGNNVSLHLIFFEFLHNEYKRSFVEMKFEKICESINKDPYLGKAFQMIGMPCPLPPGIHRMMNITVPAQDFPNVWPFEKCKVEFTLLQNQNKETMATVDVFVLFKQNPRIK
ncbi:uncharacterized protein LOC134806646 [Cydia splendana]|uniref:uncharacterized protein LOC134806646 n=1 Tax=Cydia splendana TaxID=1100963 RepID=UPI00300C0BF8